VGSAPSQHQFVTVRGNPPKPFLEQGFTAINPHSSTSETRL
jgi:hypothetical protein